jgi:hypothetical protein
MHEAKLDMSAVITSFSYLEEVNISLWGRAYSGHQQWAHNGVARFLFMKNQLAVTSSSFCNFGFQVAEVTFHATFHGVSIM